MDHKYELQQYNTKPFSAGWDNIQVLTALQSFLFDVFAGGNFVYGYSFSRQKILKSKDSNQYACKVGSRYLVEAYEPGTLDALKRPQKTLELYEFEACPFCKKVREAVNHLNLDVHFYPCPKQGKKWRPELVKRGGKAQFPYLIDPNTNTEMYESDSIIKYLFNAYGHGEQKIPIGLRLGLLTIMLAAFSNTLRATRGMFSKIGTLPQQHLILYNYEGSPFCKYVRETLCELEIPYLQISVTRGSPNRQIVFNKYGHFQAPLIEDPNTGVAMFESKQIVDYLNSKYSKKTQ